MPFGLNESRVFTFSGTAERLAAVGTELRLKELHIQADPANANVFYVGGPELTSANGLIIPIPDTNVPAPPIGFDGYTDGTTELSNFWVLGTAGEKCRILMVRYQYGQDKR